MTKVEDFIGHIADQVETIGSIGIKRELGDSTRNHRTITVNQLIRFYSRTKGYEAITLRAIYTAIRTSNSLRRSKGRTDAIDFNELQRAISRANPTLKRAIGQLV